MQLLSTVIVIGRIRITERFRSEVLIGLSEVMAETDM